MITLRVAALAVFLLLATSFASVGIGQEKTPDAAVEQASKPVVIPDTLKSPRATMETFLHAMNDIKRDKPERINDAVTTLDLSSVNPIVREDRGSDLEAAGAREVHAEVTSWATGSTRWTSIRSWRRPA